jgi:prepilin-type N-terminal cleavage/methylation domain-containing protein
MIMRGGHRSGGFSLVELLVVLAIVGILMGISIPILRMFSQNDMDRGARSLYTMIRAARVYASTYNVETAVVYQLDQDPAANPIMDTLRHQAVRMLRGAMMVYRLPDMGNYTGLYVPTMENGGEFQPFPFGYSVLLDAPPPPNASQPNSMPPQGIAYPYPSQLDPDTDYANYVPVSGENTGALGMTHISVYLGEIGPRPQPPNAKSSQWERDAWNAWVGEYDSSMKVPLLAHVFDSGGKLYTGESATTQRFTILFAPSPELTVAERTWSTGDLTDDVVARWLGNSRQADDPQMGMIGIPIEIYRSTGRVRMGSL